MTAKPCREDEAYDAGLLAGFEDGLNEGHARGDAQASLARLDLGLALQAVWDLGDQLDSNHTRWAAATTAEKMGVSIEAHNRFSEPPRNRNEERIAELEAAIDAARAAHTPNTLDWAILANIIREVDGNHDLGAGELADRIIEHPRFAHTPSAGEGLDVERLHAAMARTEAELVRQGVIVGRDADLSDYVDAIAVAYAALHDSEDGT